MSISFDADNRIFILNTCSTAYQMRVDELGYLIHLYYGRRTNQVMDYMYVPRDCGFSPNPYDLRLERTWSLDILPQEYSGANAGDFRLSSLNMTTESGCWGADLRYVRHEIQSGKYSVEGMPSAFDRNGEAETLVITLRDDVSGLEAELYYGVFDRKNVITRAARLINTGAETIRLEKAASVCLDIPYGDWDLIHFTGKHVMEREFNRNPVINGIQTVSSRRGTSSHQHNPFVILCDRKAGEERGDCYGAMLVYSGSHRTDVEMDQSGSVRLVSGIQDEQFTWLLDSGDSFSTPEVILTFTHEGLTQLSQNYHRFIRNNICRSRYVHDGCPVLINNWEATYFNFDSDKILDIARQACELGVEMLVLDDGWFGTRNDDNSGLGDWGVNESKLRGGLEPLISSINGMGMKFGLWVEPEMVNEDSDLFRTHPEWVLRVPGRGPAVSRNQLVLDLSRRDVVDYLYESLSDLLRKYNIEYIKWDMNRSITDVYSGLLPPEKQGEVYHRYVLGLYSLLERLTTEFPDVLIEGCSGGGGRYDAGMLVYSPQIWCSDDTDAIERLKIQYGTSFGYPLSTMGAHVSACPNHQTGRTTSIGTRAVVAMAGTFGYEMDLNRITDDEKAQVREQIARFHRLAELIREGDYYRLDLGSENHYITAWEIVSEDKREALISAVITHPRLNMGPARLLLRGLDPDEEYVIESQNTYGGSYADNQVPMKRFIGGRETSTGAALMYGGYYLPLINGDYPAVQIHLKRKGQN